MSQITLPAGAPHGKEFPFGKDREGILGPDITTVLVAMKYEKRTAYNNGGKQSIRSILIAARKDSGSSPGAHPPRSQSG